MRTRCLLVQLLLAFAAQSRTHELFCPPTCTCVMDEVTQENSAICTFGNSTVYLASAMDLKDIVLVLNCKDAVENFQYDCNDLPRFNISSEEAELFMEACAPSVMRCVHDMFRPGTKFVKISVMKTAGRFTANDLADFDHAYQAQMEFRKDDTNIPTEVSDSLSALDYFIVEGGSLQLPPYTFKLAKLSHLILDGNNIRNLLPDTFNGLTSLRILNIRSNSFEHIGAHTFRGLNSLTRLTIENNTLISIAPDALSPLKHLIKLQINDNRLEIFPNGLLTALDQLRELTITNNQGELILDTHAFADLLSVKWVDISMSKLKYLPEHVLNGSTALEQLSFLDCNIEYIPPKIFATTTSLEYVDLSRNKIQSLPEELFTETKSLVFVELSYNNISTLRGDIFTHSSMLKIVNLNFNALTYMDRDIFKGTKLISLTLACNKLQRIIGNTTLEWQTRKLNLSQNELSVFEDWFVELTDLQDLDLSGNKIQMIKESHLYRFNSNVTIDLRNNSITEIVRDTPELFVNVTPGAASLYLSNNPLQCDCVVTTLLKEWHTYGILADYEHITCDKEGELSNLDVYIQCNKTHAFVALVGSSVVGALVLIIILSYIFTHRRKILTYLTNLFDLNKLAGIFNKQGITETFEMKEEVKPYDLFISFAHQDSDLVTDKLLPILENDFQLKVCVHYRDWVVGDLIPVQIKESVENSTMTMIILTEHFLESEWSTLEFRTAHDLSKEEGKSRVILVLINESVIRHDKLHGELKAYIDMNTYLVWDDIFFFDKLQKILPGGKKNKHKIRSLK